MLAVEILPMEGKDLLVLYCHYHGSLMLRSQDINSHAFHLVCLEYYSFSITTTSHFVFGHDVTKELNSELLIEIVALNFVVNTVPTDGLDDVQIEVYSVAFRKVRYGLH